MSTDHSHNHEHPHDMAPIGDREKMKKLLEHWLQHNEDHAKTYEKWADVAEESGEQEVVKALRKSAKLTREINIAFEKALRSLA